MKLVRPTISAIVGVLAVALLSPVYNFKIERKQEKSANRSLANLSAYQMNKIEKKLEFVLGVNFEEDPSVLVVSRDDFCGQYDDDKNRIILNKECLVNDDSSIKKSKLAVNGPGNFNLDWILAHELGHFYVDLTDQRIKLVNSGDNSNSKKFFNNCKTRFISEGIANVFEKHISEDKNDFEDSEYLLPDFNCRELVSRRQIYNGGQKFVNDIMQDSGYSFNEGIEYLVRFNPCPNDEETIPAFRERLKLEMKNYYFKKLGEGK